MDYLPGGLIIASASARVLVMNRAAECILDGNHGLKNTPRGLCGSTARESSALQTTIAATVAARIGGVKAPVPVAISRDAARRPLQIVIAPLPPQKADTHRQPAAVLSISDPDGGDYLERTFLRKTFALTDAEARVSAALTRGRNVEEIALAFGVTLSTIRCHLKRAFLKTGTRRQGELISLLLSTGNGFRMNGQGS